MIDLYYFPSPNTWKVSIMLEECALPYRVVPINTLKQEQFSAEFLKISPNNKVPAIVDHAGPDGALSLFESGAILVYLAEKTGLLLPRAGAARARVLQWLFWQVGGLGPMAGQTHFFRRAPAGMATPQVIDRFVGESTRLYRVMELQLAQQDYLAGEYSIADIACWSWVWFHAMHQQSFADFPHVARWFAAIGRRPAVIAGRRVGLDLVTEEQRKILEQEE
jgi:GSH-dependent disulfide-bond oxidoreductase